MYVVHAARVQLTFLPPTPLPPEKPCFAPTRGGYNLHFFTPPSPYKNVSYIFWPPPGQQGVKGVGMIQYDIITKDYRNTPVWSS